MEHRARRCVDGEALEGRASRQPGRRLVLIHSAIGLVLVATVGLHPLRGAALQTRSAIPGRTLSEIVQAPVPIRDAIGVVREQVTTSSTQAGAFYNQGLAYLHSFVWIEAARSFNQALRLDANLAVAEVGLSYALGELGMSSEARSASERAQRLSGSVSAREKMTIELRTRQLAAALPNQSASGVAYRKTLDDAIAAYPDDVELLLLVGQAQDPSHDSHGMNVGSTSLPFHLRALAQSPDNFATHHFLTHAYENTREFDRALVHAERYSQLASAVPHAHHMYGHVLRRVNRMKDAIAEFEQADRLETAYLTSESIPPRYDWHYRHNLSLLGSSYQYQGRIESADTILRRSFEVEGVTPTEVDLDRKQWVMTLLAARRPSDALMAARSLASSPQPMLRALGHLLAGRAQLALRRPEDAAREGNLALADMRASGPSGGLLVPEYELLQGEFLMRTGEVDSGRTMLRRAAAKLRDATGPDAWVMTLFSLEAIARTASELGAWPVVQDFSEQMREVDAAYPGTQSVLGLLAEHDGNRAAALAYYQTAVRGWTDADPDFSGRRDAQTRIARLTAGNAPPRRP